MRNCSLYDQQNCQPKIIKFLKPKKETSVETIWQLTSNLFLIVVVFACIYSGTIILKYGQFVALFVIWCNFACCLLYNKPYFLYFVIFNFPQFHFDGFWIVKDEMGLICCCCGNVFISNCYMYINCVCSTSFLNQKANEKHVFYILTISWLQLKLRWWLAGHGKVTLAFAIDKKNSSVWCCSTSWHIWKKLNICSIHCNCLLQRIWDLV